MFAGLRIAGAVGVLSVFGGVLGAAANFALERADRRTSAALALDLERRAEAAKTALDALEGASSDVAALELEIQRAGGATVSKTALDLAKRRPGPKISRAINALVGVAAPAEPPDPPIGPVSGGLLWPIAGALLGAVFGFAWAAHRVGAPLERTLLAARAFVHGESSARADEKRGGRDARDVARAVNALMESAERKRLQGRAAREEDVRAMAVAIAALGRGELAEKVPAVSDALLPVRDALESTRKEMVGRFEEIQKMSIEIAENVSEVAPNARRIARAASDQLDALRALSEDAQQATGEVKAATERLGEAVRSLGQFSEGERRTSREVQNALLGAGRRVQDLKRGAEEVQALAATTLAIDEALDVLAQTANAENPPPKARVTNAVGQGRAGMQALSRELDGLREQMGDVASSLESIAKAVPDSAAELQSAVTESLHDAAARLLRIVERTAVGIKALERTAVVLSEGAAQIAGGAVASAELAPRIGAVVAELSLGASFEAQLLERLERWKKEAEAAKASPDGLTADGRQLVKQVVEASEQARQRLARLVSVTENAIDVLRG